MVVSELVDISGAKCTFFARIGYSRNVRDEN